MKAREIELYVAEFIGVRKHIMVTNVSWGMLPWGESDLIIMSNRGYLTEIEIKTSLKDLQNDKAKKRWTPYFMKQFDELISEYYVALPMDVYVKTQPEDFQPFAGIMTIHPDAEYKFRKVQYQSFSKKKKGRMLSDEERFKLMRLGVMRYWSHHPAKVKG